MTSGQRAPRARRRTRGVSATITKSRHATTLAEPERRTSEQVQPDAAEAAAGAGGAVVRVVGKVALTLGAPDGGVVSAAVETATTDVGSTPSGGVPSTATGAGGQCTLESGTQTQKG